MLVAGALRNDSSRATERLRDDGCAVEELGVTRDGACDGQEEKVPDRGNLPRDWGSPMKLQHCDPAREKL